LKFQFGVICHRAVRIDTLGGVSEWVDVGEKWTAIVEISRVGGIDRLWDKSVGHWFCEKSFPVDFFEKTVRFNLIGTWHVSDLTGHDEIDRCMTAERYTLNITHAKVHKNCAKRTKNCTNHIEENR
jgi:hypothetical protein